MSEVFSSVLSISPQTQPPSVSLNSRKRWTGSTDRMLNVPTAMRGPGARKEEEEVEEKARRWDLHCLDHTPLKPNQRMKRKRAQWRTKRRMCSEILGSRRWR